MTESWGMDVVRAVFATIDRAIYSLIAIVYEILLDISEVTIFTEASIQDFATRIYSLLGLIMLFKVTFSFINYIVNPDQMNDKSKGASKVIVNVIITLVLIIITPFAFDKLYEAQTAILKDNIIPKFILGTDGSSNINSVGIEYKISEYCSNENAIAKSDGDLIALMVFRPFYQIEPSKNSSDDVNEYCSIGTGRTGAKVSDYLISDIYNNAPNGTKDTYTIDYQFFLSTIVGIVVLLILISFCFDVAVRAIKLGFLQIIAPIPIISYVDPDSSKNGMFKKWLKEVGKTWADLFVRLIALFFAIFIIKETTAPGAVFSDLTGNVLSNQFWVQLFIIIGALMFAKKLPQLLSDLLGIKFDGGLTLNPMKKIRDNALGGKAITGGLKAGAALGVGAVLGTGANLYNLGSSIRNDGLKKALMGESKGIRGGLRAIGTVAGVGAGGISAAVHGAYGTYKNDSFKKGVMPGLKTSVDNRDTRDKRQDAGYGIGTRMLDSLKGAAGIKTEAKNRAIGAGNTIAGLQTAQQNIAFEMRQYTSGLNAEQLSSFSQASVDKNGNYSFVDENNKKLEWNGKNQFTEADLMAMIGGNTFGSIADANAALEYIKLQAESNKISKRISDFQKKQALYQKEDSDKKK